MLDTTLELEPRGIEPLTALPDAQGKQSVATIRRETLAQSLAHEAEKDPELARVIHAWPHLPDAIRRGILAMIGTCQGSEPDCVGSDSAYHGAAGKPRQSLVHVWDE